jgi:ABC-type uncharacterized transport system permease subunit
MFTSPLRLQAQIFSLGVQSNLIYRWNFLLRVLVSFVPLLGSVFLWQAVFSGKRRSRATPSKAWWLILSR